MKTFLVLIGAIALCYLAQTTFKIASAYKSGTFDWKSLLNGLVIHVIYFIGVMIFYFAGTLVPDMEVSIIQGESLTITQGLVMLATYLLVRQATKVFTNIKEFYEIEVGDIKENYPAQDAVLGTDVVEETNEKEVG